MGDLEAEGDSRESAGARIPGAPGVAPFVLSGPEPSVLPILIAVPHAGRCYPRSLLRDLRHPDSAGLKLEDRYVDKLAGAIAAATGAGLLVAQAPRAMIDLNRAPEDVDWEMFAAGDRPAGVPWSASRRARAGLGLIPRRLPGLGELWRRRQERDDLKARIAGIHQPYHAALAGILQALRTRWGGALLIDLHSMPPLPASAGQPAPQFVIGDRFGSACHGSLVAAAFQHFASDEWLVAHNRPYAGGYVLERHGHPSAGIHAMQIEVDRSCYLDADLREPGAGFDAVAHVLAELVRRLAALVVEAAPGKGSGFSHGGADRVGCDVSASF